MNEEFCVPHTSNRHTSKRREEDWLLQLNHMRGIEEELTKRWYWTEVLHYYSLTLSGVVGYLTVTEIVALFKAIAMMRGLKKLNMPEWESVVGGYAVACADTLRAIPSLDSVFVSEVQQSHAFPVILNFVAIQQAGVDSPIVVE